MLAAGPEPPEPAPTADSPVPMLLPLLQRLLSSPLSADSLQHSQPHTEHKSTMAVLAQPPLFPLPNQPPSQSLPARMKLSCLL